MRVAEALADFLQRAWQETPGFGRDPVASNDRKATNAVALRPRRTVRRQRRDLEETRRKRRQAAAKILHRRLNLDCAVDTEGRRGAQDARWIYKEDISGNVYIAAVAAKCIGNDAAVIEDHKVRIDGDVPAITKAATNRRRDRAIAELHQ